MQWEGNCSREEGPQTQTHLLALLKDTSQLISHPQQKRSFPTVCAEFAPEEKNRGGNGSSAGTSHYIGKAALKFLTPKESIRICLCNIAQIM
jgi:hypothetical protein